MFGLKKHKINFLLDGLSQDKKNELLSVQNWMNGLIDNEGFKVPEETINKYNKVINAIEKAFKGKEWLGNYSQANGTYSLSKIIGPAMITKEFERKIADDYKFKLECKIAVVFDLGSVHHFHQSDKYLKAQGLEEYEIQNRYTNFDLETPFYLYHFHFSKKKEVYKFLDEQDEDDYKSLKTVYDHFIERSDKLTDLSLKIKQYLDFPTKIFDSSIDYSSEYAIPYRDYGEKAVEFSKNIKFDEEDEVNEDYEEYDYYTISFREIVSDLRSDFEVLKQNYKIWNDQVQEALKSESLSFDECASIRLGRKVYIKPRNMAPKQRKQKFYYTDPNSFNNSIYEIDKRFEKNIYTQGITPKLYEDVVDEIVEYHLWIYNPIASDYDMDFEESLKYYKKYFEKEGYIDDEIFIKSIEKAIEGFEKVSSIQEEWKSKSFENKYINKLEMDEFKSSNQTQTEEIIKSIAANRKKHEDFLWYNRDKPHLLSIEQKYYLKRKIFKKLHLGDPNYSNGLNEKDKYFWEWLKEIYDKKYNFD
jgi:hypothetical protein